MTDIQVALTFFIIIAWSSIRSKILKSRFIPKWLDISLAGLCSILALYAFYDTFLK